MSRHEIAGRDPRDRVIVGWDQPLQTFFVHVFKDGARRRDGDPHVWLGGSPRELYDFNALEHAIRPHAQMSLQLIAALYNERDEGR